MIDFLVIAVYITVWWLMFAMLLPIGANPPKNPEPGHAPSAPKNSNIKQKVVWASVLSFPITWGIMQLF